MQNHRAIDIVTILMYNGNNIPLAPPWEGYTIQITMSTHIDHPEKTSILLPSEALDFYDPNSTLRSNQRSLIDALLSRPPARDNLKGWDLVLAELQSANITHPTLLEVASQADLAESNVNQIKQLLSDRADDLVDKALSKTTELSAVIGGGKDQDVTLASATLSASSHRHDKPRLSGGPYFNHPRAVAKIIDIAWRFHAPEQKDELDLQLKLSLGLLHDTWENMFKKKSVSFLDGERELVTPFLYAHLLGKLGVEQARAEAAAAGLRRVTKQPDAYGHPQDYETYILKDTWDEDAATAKIADIHHNLRLNEKPVNSNPEKSRNNHKKRVQYYEAPDLIRHSLNTDSVPVSLMLSYIKHITNAALYENHNPVLNLDSTDLELPR